MDRNPTSEKQDEGLRIFSDVIPVQGDESAFIPTQAESNPAESLHAQGAPEDLQKALSARLECERIKTEDDPLLKGYVDVYAPFIEVSGVSVFEKLKAYKRLEQDVVELRTLRDDPIIQEFLTNYRPLTEIPAAKVDEHLQIYLKIATSKGFTDFKATLAAEADKLAETAARQEAERKTEASRRAARRLVKKAAAQPETKTPTKPSAEQNKFANSAGPITEEIALLLAVNRAQKRVADAKPSKPKGQIKTAEAAAKVRPVVALAADVYAGIHADVKNKIATTTTKQKLVAGAGLMAVVGSGMPILLEKPPITAAQMEEHHVSGGDVFRDAPDANGIGGAMQIIIGLHPDQNPKEIQAGARELTEFAAAAARDAAKRPEIAKQNPSLEQNIAFLDTFTKVISELPAVKHLSKPMQQLISANGMLLNAINKHHGTFAADKLAIIGTPDNEFQSALVGMLRQDNIFGDTGEKDPNKRHSPKEKQAILTIMSRMYDLSYNSTQKKVLVDNARNVHPRQSTGSGQEHGTHNKKEGDHASGRRNRPSAHLNPQNYQRGHILHGEELKQAEFRAADRGFDSRVRDLRSQIVDSGMTWPEDGRFVKPISAERLTRILNEMDSRYNDPIINREFVLGVLFQESKFDPTAGSSMGAKGIGQFTDETWADFGNGKNVRDPEAATDATFRDLIRNRIILSQKFPEKESSEIGQLTLGAYNAGANGPDIEMGILPQNDETRNYVAIIGRLIKQTKKFERQAVDALHEANLPVPNGAIDLGLHIGAVKGEAKLLKLVALRGIPNSGEESTPGSRYYIPGANGLVVVHATFADSVMKLNRMAIKKGLKLRARSSFRTWKHQQELWDANPNPMYVAHAGGSRHQGGKAVDWDLNGLPLVGQLYRAANGSEPTPFNPAVAPGSKIFRFLKSALRKVDERQYYPEPWHDEAND